MSKSEFYLEDIISKRNFYLKFNPEFVKNILLEITDIRPPYKDKQLAEKLKLDFNSGYGISTSIRNWFQNKNSIPSSKIEIILKLSKYNWKDIENNLISIKTGNGRATPIKLTFPIKLDRKLGLLVGHILGDGSIGRKYSSVFFSNSNKALLEEFHNLIREIFNLEPRIWLQESGNFKTRTKWIKRLYNTDEIENSKDYGIFCSKIIGELLFCIFGKFAFGKFKKIPNITLSASRDFRVGLVRAFFDDECNVNESRVIRVFQDDKRILDNLRAILINLGIQPCNVHSYIKGGKKRFYFDISGIDNLIKYREIIGSSHPEKRFELDTLIDKLQSSKLQKLRIGQTKDSIMDLLKSGPLSTSDVIARLKNSHPRIGWNDSVVRKHLFQLSNERKVTKYKIGKNYFWNLLIP